MPLPNTPADVRLDPGNQQIAVQWDAALDASSYEVRYSATRNGPYTVLPVLTGTSYVLRDLVNQQWYVEVRSVNAIGMSTWSTPAAATPAESETSAIAPTVLAVEGEGGQIRLGWDAPAGAVDRDTTYDYAYSPDDTAPTPGSSAHTLVRDVPGRAHLIVGLANGTPYYIWVRTNSPDGPSPWSARQTATPTLATGMDAPVATTSAESGQVRLSWTEVPNATGYDYAYGTNAATPAEVPGPDYTAFAVLPSVRAVLVSGLADGTAYHFWARTRGPSGVGSWSADAPATPLQSAGPAIPQAVTLAAGNRTVRVTFEPIDGATDYDYAFNGGSSDLATATIVDNPRDISEPIFEIVGLTNGTQYSVWVRATSERGPGAWSVAAQVRPTDTSPPLPPRGLMAAVDATTAIVEWTGDSAVTGHDYRWREGSGGAWNEVLALDAEPRVTLTGLAIPNTYEFQVRARNAHGESAWSRTLTLRPFEIPTGLSGVAGDLQVVLAWDLNSLVTDYDYRYRAVGDSEWVEDRISTIIGDAVLIDVGLANGVPYEFEVRANIGTSRTYWTPALVLTPRRTIAGLPTNVATTVGPGEITLTWTAPAGATAYDYRFRAGTDGPWMQVNDEPGTTIVVHNLVAGQSYAFEVRAKNPGGGITDWTEPVAATPVDSIYETPAIIGIVAAPVDGTQDLDLTMRNNLPAAARVSVTVEVELPGREHAYAYALPADFEKALEVTDASRDGVQPEQPVLDGHLLYTNIERPLLKYVGSATDDAVHGAIALPLELLLTAALARKFQRDMPLAREAHEEYLQHLLSALQTVSEYIDLKSIRSDSVLDSESERE